jgi:hypothetical protein
VGRAAEEVNREGATDVAVCSATEANVKAFAKRHGISRRLTDNRKIFEVQDLRPADEFSNADRPLQPVRRKIHRASP